MTLKPQDVPTTTDDIPFDAGSRALLDNADTVIVVTVEGDRRYVTLTPAPDVWIRNAEGKLVLNRQWVNVERLTSATTLDTLLAANAPATIVPDPTSVLEALPDDGIDIDALKAHLNVDGTEDGEAAIAEKELDLAKQRDEMAAQLAQKDQTIKALRHETESLSDQVVALERQLDALTADYDKKLKAQLEISNGLKRELHMAVEIARALEASLPSQRMRIEVKRKIETTTHPDIDDGSLTDFINQGWRVVFEAAYVLPARDKEVCHMVRLEREVPDTAHPPLEARADRGQDIPFEMIYEDGDRSDQDDVPVHEQVEEIYIHMDARPVLDEPAWKAAPDEAQREAMIYMARKATLGSKAAGRMIAQTRAWQKRQRADDLVQVGHLLIDPKTQPLTATLSSGITGEELIDAMNEKVRVKVMDAMRAAQPTRPAPVPLMLGQ